MPKIQANGISLNYRLDGPEDAPVLMLSNSLGTNLGMWDWQVERFTASYRLLRYDSRGHGDSDAPEGNYTIEMLANDALGLLDALEIRRVRYCGLSKGGMVGQWLGANAGDRLERLVLCNTSSFLPPRELWDQRIEAALAGGLEPMMDSIVDRWFTKEFQASHPQDVDKIRAMILSTPGHGYAGCCAAIRAMDQRESIKTIAVPTLVVVGAKDPATPPEHGEYLRESISGARLVSLEAAHLSNIEAQDAFNQAVLDFLA